MTTTTPQGITLRSAALVAALGVLVGLGVPVAEFIARPVLIVPGSIDETIRAIGASRGLFVASVFAYFIAFAADVVVAWALYVLLAPVNRAVSLLAAWFRLAFAVTALGALMNMASVLRLLDSPDAATGSGQLHAHIQILLHSFQWEWGLGMLLFGVHLALLGSLVYRSAYIPGALGVGLIVAGVGYLIYYLQPYLYPNLDLAFFFLAVTGLGELAFLLWLLVRGRKLEDSRSSRRPPEPRRENLSRHACASRGHRGGAAGTPR